MAHSVIYHNCHDVVYIANVFFEEIVRLYGGPRTIISNRDIEFLSYFWRCLRRLVGTELLFNTTYQPQIDGKIEVTSRTLTTLLRNMVSKSLRDWNAKLSHVSSLRIGLFPILRLTPHLRYCIASTISLPLILFLVLKNPRWALRPRKSAKEMKRLHEQVRAQIKKVID